MFRLFSFGYKEDLGSSESGSRKDKGQEGDPSECLGGGRGRTPPVTRPVPTECDSSITRDHCYLGRSFPLYHGEGPDPEPGYPETPYLRLTQTAKGFVVGQEGGGQDGGGGP